MSSEKYTLKVKKPGLGYKIVKILAIFFMKIVFRYNVKMPYGIPEGGCIFCSNHTNMIDPVLLGVAIKPKIYYMAKEELFEKKIIARFLYQLGAFPIKRGKNDKSAITFSKKLIAENNRLCIFIEGTRSKTGELLPPKAGAIMIAYATNVPIVPVCISQKSGKPIKAFCKVTVNIGKAITTDELGIVKGRGSEYRNASRMVMEKIRALRAEDVQNNTVESELTVK